ncbi:MAG: hypothetical protein AB1646_24340 [Thermodesulfobacteriota bacterium]
MEFRSSAPGVEVFGAVVAAFLAAFPKGTEAVGVSTLAAQGIKNPDPEKWYPLQSLLNAMKDVAAKMGVDMLRRIGEGIAGNAILPPGWTTLESVLSGIDTAYHLNHRGGEIGHYEFHDEGVSSGLRRIRMECPNPYPCVFDQGTIDGFANRFRPPGCIDVLVRHDDAQPCRQHGADSCTYVVSWA